MRRRSLFPLGLIFGLAVSLLPGAVGAEGEIPDWVPSCPPAIADANLYDTSGASIAPNGKYVTLNCSYSASDGYQNPRYDPDTGLYRNWGSASFSIKAQIGERYDACPSTAGTRVLEEGTGTWPSGLAGSWPTGDGEFTSPTHLAELTWHYGLEDGLTPELVENTAMGLFNQIAPNAIPCEPVDPVAPIGPAGCPAAIGDYVLYDGPSELEPQTIEGSHTTYLRVECEYWVPFHDGVGALWDDRLLIRAGWMVEPTALDATLDREGQTCTSRRVPVDHADNVYVAESMTHVARAALFDGDADADVIEPALQAIITHLEGIATLCPDGPDQTTTTTTTVPEEEEPGGETCAPQGTVTDHAGAPMPGLRVQLRLSDEVADQRVTDEDGWYQFSDLATLADAYQFDPATDSYDVAVILRDAVEGASRFEIRFGPDGVLPEIRRESLTVEDDPSCVADFGFDSIDDEYAVAAGPDIPGYWRSLAHGYQGIRKAYEFAADTLGTELAMPLPVFMFCQGNPDGVHGRACGGSAAYFRGGFTTDEVADGPPFIAFNPPFSRGIRAERPINGEYHEFGHALMADAFGGFMPTRPGSENHRGYLNSSSTDSWTEGFAEWFGSQVSRAMDGNPRWWLYPVGGKITSLEDDHSVTDTHHGAEELGIAGILVDMVDGDADYTAPTQRQLTPVGYRFYENPAVPGQMLMGVEVRNDMPSPQSNIAVKADFGGVAGLFATRVDGFVDSDTLAPGASGLSVIPVPRGMGESDFKTVKVVGFGVGDDDSVTRTAAEVWQAIIGYSSASEHSKGFMMDTSELYEGMREAFPSDAAGIDAIFVAHGLFADRDPRDGVRGATEDIGVTSPNGERIRLDASPAEVFSAVVDTGEVESRVLVQVLYPEPKDALSYAYVALPDADGAVSVAVPPASTGGRVRLVILAEGRMPALLPDIEAGAFWEEAAAGEYASFLTYVVDLPVGDVLSGAVSLEGGGGFPVLWLILGLGLGVVVVGGGLWWRLRRSRGGIPALPGPEE